MNVLLRVRLQRAFLVYLSNLTSRVANCPHPVPRHHGAAPKKPRPSQNGRSYGRRSTAHVCARGRKADQSSQASCVAELCGNAFQQANTLISHGNMHMDDSAPAKVLKHLTKKKHEGAMIGTSKWFKKKHWRLPLPRGECETQGVMDSLLHRAKDPQLRAETTQPARGRKMMAFADAHQFGAKAPGCSRLHPHSSIS